MKMSSGTIEAYGSRSIGEGMGLHRVSVNGPVGSTVSVLTGESGSDKEEGIICPCTVEVGGSWSILLESPLAGRFVSMAQPVSASSGGASWLVFDATGSPVPRKLPPYSELVCLVASTINIGGSSLILAPGENTRLQCETLSPGGKVAINRRFV